MLENSRRDFMRYVGIAATATGTASGGVAAREADDGSERRGTIDKLGQALPENPPRYTYGHVREDGLYGCVSSFPEGGNEYASTLYDLSDLESPEEVHRLPPANALTRSNDVKFDPRNGLYYRSQEADDFGEDDQQGEMGVEAVDYGYAAGTPEEPEVVARIETPNTGVHKLTVHPEVPILYLVDKDGEEPGIISVDISDPSEPSIRNQFGPDGYCHDVEVDPIRNVLHAAYIAGDFVGYVIFDLDDPYRPAELSRVDYADLPDYEAIGEPGFELCHQAHYDPRRDLAIVGDEVGTGIPGGKHVYDIGWDEGSLENPIHIGFTHSPNAKEQTEEEAFFWTTHFHDVITRDDATLLVDGGYHEGTWLCDISDPRNPEPAEQYPTRDREDESAGHPPSHAPYCWSAIYNEERGFVFASDTLTGVYTFRVDDDHFEFRTVEEELTDDEGGIDADGIDLATHYYLHHASVPNTGGEPMTRSDLQRLLTLFERGGREGALAGRD